MLPFGTLGDVDTLAWRTIGDPDRWPFVYHDREQGFFEVKGLSAVESILEAVTQLMIRLRSGTSFAPPCEFRAYMAEPRSVRFFHCEPIDVDDMVSRLASRWPTDEVSTRSSEWGATLGIESLAGSIYLGSAGDERTEAVLSYDRRYAIGVDRALEALSAEGFREIGREGFPASRSD